MGEVRAPKDACAGGQKMIHLKEKDTRKRKNNTRKKKKDTGIRKRYTFKKKKDTAGNT